MTATKDPRSGIDADRAQLERDQREQFADKRGGQFFIIDGSRIHESDLTDEQRTAVGLPLAESQDTSATDVATNE